MNIYVGNLSYDANDTDLRELFESYGEVSAARVILDKFTGKSRGFGFVEMPNDDEAQKAIEATNGLDHLGRSLRVNESQPRPPREHGGGGGRGRR
jgi:RNA recognition motif-containing protein